MKQCILILGMHRSGTSAISGMLNILGIYQGRHLLPPSRENRKGFFENKRILDFNEKVLSEHGANWDDIFFTDRQLTAEKFTEELKQLIDEEFGQTECFSIKDPRICLLFPIYEKALDEMGIEIHPVLIYRNPLETAVSLQKRDGFSLEKGLILWLDHFLLAEKYTRSYTRLFVAFDQLLKNYAAVIALIRETWAINLESDADQQKALNTFLQPSLKHVNLSLESLEPKLPSSIHQLIRIFSAPEEIENSQNVIDDIRQAYFRDKTFFLFKELQESLKKVDPYRYAQFFIDTGNGFCEKQSQRIFYPEAMEKIALDLSAYANIRAIRFDPVNQAAVISVDSVKFQLETGAWCEAAANPSNAAYVLNGTAYFAHDDPQYDIPVPHVNSPIKLLEIHTLYHKIGGREVAPEVSGLLRQLLQRHRGALVRRLIKSEHWWREKYETEKRRLQSEVQTAEQKANVLEQHLNAERLAINELEQKLKAIQIENSRLMAENQSIRKELQDIYNSKTWRLTRPLRKLIP